MKRTFYVKAIWDDEVNVWYSESDIFGLHIESKSLDEFEDVINEFAVELIIANHLTAEDLAQNAMKELLPLVIWHRPAENLVAA